MPTAAGFAELSAAPTFHQLSETRCQHQRRTSQLDDLDLSSGNKNIERAATDAEITTDVLP